MSNPTTHLIFSNFLVINVLTHCFKGKIPYEAYLALTQRTSEDVLEWQRGNLSYSMRAKGFDADNTEDALKYWASLLALTQVPADPSSVPGADPIATTLKACTGTCVLDKQVAPAAIFTKLPWCGRQVEVDIIRSATQRNLWAHSEKDGTKQMYDFVLVYGASGMGKSRLCYEASQQLVTTFNNLTNASSPEKEAKVLKIGKKAIENFSAKHYLFTDFSSGAGFSKIEHVLPAIRLGLRLAAAFFLQSTVSDILAGMQQAGLLNQMHTFTLGRVASFISTHLPEGKHIALMWHFDEFHHVPTDELKELLRELGTFMTTQHHHRILITPLFCGTASVQISKELIISGFRFKDIFLQKLARDQSKHIVCQVLAKCKPITSPLLDQALAQLGDWPRFLQLFCNSCECTLEYYSGMDLEQFYTSALRATLHRIYETFGVNKINNWRYYTFVL